MRNTPMHRRGRQRNAIIAALQASLFGLLVPLGLIAAPMLTPPARAQFISEKEEMEMGREAAAEVEQSGKVIRGTPDAKRVERIGRKMAAVSGRPNIPWHFAVINDPSVNAFSVPGYVYVNTGLIKAANGDMSQLAGVIAHEVGHVAAGHSRKQMEKGAIAGLVGSVLARNEKQAGVLNIAGNLLLLKFSRDDEFDADKRAVGYLLKTGYDPNGMVRMFQTMEKMESKNSRAMTFFRTHPNSSDRVSRIKGYIRDRKAGSSRSR